MTTLLGPLLGLVVGRALGGRMDRLAGVPYRWIPLGAAALGVQLALFSTGLGDALGSPLAPLAYVASTAAVLAVVLRNLRLPRLGMPGLALVALGAASNLAAIIANGGWMPLDPGALAALGEDAAAAGGYSNSLVLADPALAPLIDRIPIPGPGPLATVASVGDLLIALGLAVAIVRGMRAVTPPGEGSAAGT